MDLHFSGKDNLLPSEDEAKRLLGSLQNCKIRCFKDNGHTILLVGEFSLFFSFLFSLFHFLDVVAVDC